MRSLVLLLTLLAFTGTLSSQSLGYENYRIAISADGNNQADNHPEAKWPRADPDDWGGTPAALAMIAKLNLHDQLVHYSYNNFIEAPAHTTERNYMKEGVDGAVERWSFDPEKFFDVSEDDTLAILHLSAELEKSTAENPLYFIHMGPAEFFYQAVKNVVDSGKIETLAHVQVISHSGYNDTHLRRLDHHTMPEAITLSGSRIMYKKISDQNACDNPNHLWCSGTDFSPFYWMRDHSDPNIQWLYSRLLFHPSGKGADISDAGMVYYLTVGDEFGNLSKFEDFIGAGIPVGPITAVEGVTLTPDSIKVYAGRVEALEANIFPADAWNKQLYWISTNSEVAVISAKGELMGKSKGEALIIVRTDEGSFSDTTHVTVDELPECENTEYFGSQDFVMQQIDTFVSPYIDQARNAVAVDASKYKNRFAATQKIYDGVTGFYNITLTTLTEIDGECSYRFSINGKLIGEFQNPSSSSDYQEYDFTFENVLIEHGDIIQIESNTHSNGKIPEGEAFAFARGRWRSIFFECMGECVIQDKDGLLVFEAERFELKGQWKLGTDPNYASGGEYIYFSGANSYQTVNQNDVISFSFRIKTAGKYTFKWTMRQPEGERGTDKGNDAWIYFDGNIANGGTYNIDHYVKFVGRSGDEFVMNGNADIHDVGQKWVTVDFPSAGEYTLNIGGRSHGLQIDRIILFKGMTFDEAEQKIKDITETSTCGTIIPVEPTRYFSTPKSLISSHTDSTVIIDGEEDEFWEYVVKNYSAFEAEGKSLPKKNDLSYSYKTVYDTTNIYFFIEVYDDLKYPYAGTNVDYWNSDNVELYFNPDNEHELDGSYGNDGLQIRLNYGNDSSLYSGNGIWKAVNFDGFKYSWKDKTDGYTIEAQIPWKGIGINTLSENLKLGFDIAIRDMDEGIIPDHILTWANDTETGSEGKDTRKFGTMVLGSMEYQYLDRSSWKVIYADSEADDPGQTLNLKENILDGDPNTKWHTKWFSEQTLLPHEIQIDFGGVYEISNMHYLPRQDEYGPNGTIGEYEIYISKSKDIWGNPIHKSNFYYGEAPSQEDYQILQKVQPDSMVQGRYFRLVALTEAQNDTSIQQTSISELNFLGKYISEPINPLDSVPPAIQNLSGNIYAEANPETCTAIAYWSTPRARDNYNEVSLFSDHEQGNSFEIGITPVTYTAIDAAGNASFASFDVIVTDPVVPVFTSYPDNIIDTLEDGENAIAINWETPVIAQQCSNVALNSTHKSGDLFNAGETEVKYVAVNESGLADSITFLIQIERGSGLNNNSSNSQLSIYPNPAKDKLYIYNAEYQNTEILIYNLTGKLIGKHTCQTSEMEIDLSKTEPGIYFITVKGKNKTVHKKIIFDH